MAKDEARSAEAERIHQEKLRVQRELELNIARKLHEVVQKEWTAKGDFQKSIKHDQWIWAQDWQDNLKTETMLRDQQVNDITNILYPPKVKPKPKVKEEDKKPEKIIPYSQRVKVKTK